jgi:GNAT superfamily N-acetyltransferase
MPSVVEIANSDEDIQACHQVMAELRPHMGSPQKFLTQIRRQQGSGYQLAFVREGNQVVAAAGFRINECLAWGRYLYVDDLVTAAATRSRGHGKELLEWLSEYAKKQGCQELHLDSGVQRFDAHRFYLRERMWITSHHFARKLLP